MKWLGLAWLAPWVQWNFIHWQFNSISILLSLPTTTKKKPCSEITHLNHQIFQIKLFTFILVHKKLVQNHTWTKLVVKNLKKGFFGFLFHYSPFCQLSINMWVFQFGNKDPPSSIPSLIISFNILFLITRVLKYIYINKSHNTETLLWRYVYVLLTKLFYK